MQKSHLSPKQLFLRLLPLILLFFCPRSFAVSVERIELPVGKVLLLSTNGRHVDPSQFPKWCRFNQSDGQIYGIPALSDLGVHVISMENHRVEVNVFEEVQNSCGETDTLWVDVLDGRKLSDVSIPEQFNALKSLVVLLKDVVPKVGLEDWRILSYNYANDRYRKIDTPLSESVARDRLGSDGKPIPDQMVLTMNLSCGELNDFSTDILNVLTEKQSFMVVEGFLNAKRVPIIRADESVIPMKLPMTPVNIEKTDTPVGAKQNPSFVCKKGTLCRIKIGDDAFPDSINILTSHWTISMYQVNGVQKNFFVHIPGTDIFEGVPLNAEAGDTLNFKLEARDKSGKTISIPFQVYMGQIPVKNHEYVMVLNTPAERFKDDPKTLRKLIILLVASIKKTKINTEELISDPLLLNSLYEVRINDIQENGPNQSTVKWSNATMLVDSWPCEKSPPSDLKSKACYASPPPLFILSNTSLDSAFGFEQIIFQQEPVEWSASAFANSPLNLVKQDPVQDESSSRSWVPMLIALILILLILAVLAFYLLKRNLEQKKSKTRTQKNGKGLNGGSMSTVTTPMLVDVEKNTVPKATTTTTIVLDLSPQAQTGELVKTPDIEALPFVIDETANVEKP